MTNLKEVSGFELIERIELRGENAHSWIAIVATASLDPNIVQLFAEEWESQSDAKNMVRIVHIEGLLPSDIRDRVQSPDDDAVILVGFEGRSREFWSNLDINRSALERSGSIFFWLSHNSLSDLCRDAPNIRSYIGPSIFVLAGAKGALSTDARKQRLKELSDKFKMSDAEIVQRAEQKTIEQEPEFVEWLLLLERGDLV
jgi:hypothetical protein